LEGHAVAFVIGNGIGVLLRMVWFMCIVTYHIIRGERGKDAQYTALVQKQDTEELDIPPYVTQERPTTI
jgi:hypothetical protein